MTHAHLTKRSATKHAVNALCAMIFLSAGAAAQPTQQHQVVPLTAKALYQGWQASRILGKDVLAKSSDKIGTVRNIVIGSKGHIEGLIVESGVSDFVYRMPWDKIDVAQFPAKIVANIPAGGERQLPLFYGTGDSKEFRITDVVGDYARLQAGFAFGYVSDVIFSPDARMLAVVVLRDASAGGGMYAFGFPSDIGQWNPAAGYYGLPYVTSEQASNAAIRVDPKQFPTDSTK